MTKAINNIADKSIRVVLARPFKSIAVLGAGSWGTALAITAVHAGRRVKLWGRRQDIVDEINDTHRNTRYLGDIALPEGLVATSNLSDAVAGCDCVLLVTPSTSVREVARKLNAILAPGIPVIVCAKGVELDSGKLMTDVAGEELPGHETGVLSGPTFADETAKRLPTAVTIASTFDHREEFGDNDILAARVAVSLGTETFRPFISDDVIGVETSGAVKNVLALLCGMIQGAGFAANTRAALITRGLDEMKNLAEVLGGRRETVTGLSGIGDLMLTCSSTQSRNFSYGLQLGQGVARDRIFDGRPVVVEGIANAASVMRLAKAKGVSMPIVEAVHAIVHEGRNLAEAFSLLWTRPLEAEPRAIAIELPHPFGKEGARRLAALMT
ncbi:MAG: NAD(P)H-dependent glycerol-3-phosphate dehydrogenase [Rhodopseudomonas sp.]|nr:NAD(P)H-dependent glycerol-3-phosphate dehydrogenase [Rhodopseudomonas sp.]